MRSTLFETRTRIHVLEEQRSTIKLKGYLHSIKTSLLLYLYYLPPPCIKAWRGLRLLISYDSHHPTPTLPSADGTLSLHRKTRGISSYAPALILSISRCPHTPPVASYSYLLLKLALFTLHPQPSPTPPYIIPNGSFYFSRLPADLLLAFHFIIINTPALMLIVHLLLPTLPTCNYNWSYHG